MLVARALEFTELLLDVHERREALLDGRCFGRRASFRMQAAGGQAAATDRRGRARRRHLLDPTAIVQARAAAHGLGIVVGDVHRWWRHALVALLGGGLWRRTGPLGGCLWPLQSLRRRTRLPLGAARNRSLHLH